MSFYPGKLSFIPLKIYLVGHDFFAVKISIIWYLLILPQRNSSWWLVSAKRGKMRVTVWFCIWIVLHIMELWHALYYVLWVLDNFSPTSAVCLINKKRLQTKGKQIRCETFILKSFFNYQFSDSPSLFRNMLGTWWPDTTCTIPISLKGSDVQICISKKGCEYCKKEIFFLFIPYIETRNSPSFRVAGNIPGSYLVDRFIVVRM